MEIMKLYGEVVGLKIDLKVLKTSRAIWKGERPKIIVPLK